MKTIPTLIMLLAFLATAIPLAAQEPANSTPAPATETNTPPATDATPVAEAAPATDVTNTATNGGLRLNFRGVPLEMVLNYLSDAAGFIIVLDAQPRGKVDVWSNTPLTKDEAVDLLNSVLNKNGLASIRNGRTLTIVNKDEAKTKNIPVKKGSKPEGIPNNDEIVTQIIPVRFVEVAQLIKDLQPLVATATTMTANEAGNSIVITDTQANIRRVAEIIQAIDLGAESMTEVEVFRLQYTDPTEMATLLTSVFPDESRSGSSQSPIQFGGRGGLGNLFGGGGGRGGRDGGNSSGGDQNSRIKKLARVIAVPDARTQSVIVSAASDLMQQIKGMVQQLDSNPAKQQIVRMHSLENADAQQVEQVLSEMFETTTTRNNNRNSQNQNNALQNRANQNQQNTTTTTTRGRGNTTGGAVGGGGF